MLCNRVSTGPGARLSLVACSRWFTTPASNTARPPGQGVRSLPTEGISARSERQSWCLSTSPSREGYRRGRFICWPCEGRCECCLCLGGTVLARLCTVRSALARWLGRFFVGRGCSLSTHASTRPRCHGFFASSRGQTSPAYCLSKRELTGDVGAMPGLRDRQGENPGPRLWRGGPKCKCTRVQHL